MFLLPKIGVLIDSICSELICAINVPCGIKIELFFCSIELQRSLITSENESTSTNSSINLNRSYNFCRFFSQINNVLNPSSFAPFSS